MFTQCKVPKVRRSAYLLFDKRAGLIFIKNKNRIISLKISKVQVMQ